MFYVMPMFYYKRVRKQYFIIFTNDYLCNMLRKSDLIFSY